MRRSSFLIRFHIPGSQVPAWEPPAYVPKLELGNKIRICSFLRSAFLLLFATLACAAVSAADVAWQHPLYLAGDGYWHDRIPLTVANGTDADWSGRAVGVPVGKSAGQIDLVDVEARSIRVCEASGAEIIFGVTDPGGVVQEEGAIRAGSVLTIPVTCPARQRVTFWVYFNNPSAGLVPDMFTTRTGLVNGDVEEGSGDTPSGWRHDEADGQHRASWSDERPQSGRRCLKTVVVEGAEPTWIVTRQTGIMALPGAKYVFTAWVRAEDVRGQAGWYLHVGDDKTPMMIAPTVGAGQGTFDWKQVRTEFTAPAGATKISLGTVLRGTGTAWFDNARLECSQATSLIRVEVGPRETMSLSEPASPTPWYREGMKGPAVRERRAVVKLFNFAQKPREKRLIHLNLDLIRRRMRGQLNADSFVVVSDGRPVPFHVSGSVLSLQDSVPGRTVRRYDVYFTDRAEVRPLASDTDAAIRWSQSNLLKNASFEEGTQTPDGWDMSSRSPDVGFSLDQGGAPGCGSRCAKLHVPEATKPTWRGWTQTVPVEPGKSYLVSAWLKAEKLGPGGALLHIHFRNAKGGLCEKNAMQSAGPALQGTSEWTSLGQILRAPADAAKLTLHLTMNTTGTLWHDGAMVAQVEPASVVSFEGLPAVENAPQCNWPVPAVKKVFPDDPAPPGDTRAEIALARNEQEPLQLAFRFAHARKNVRIECGPLVGPGGAKLDPPTVNVVGYVPIDYATNYYHLPDGVSYERKIPVQGPASDGWPGWWPDPLLPRATLDVQANFTQAVWITVTAGKNTPPGDYEGPVQFRCGGALLASRLLRVHVWDFTLPDENHVKAIYDVRPTSRGNLWGEPASQVYRQMVEFLARRRLCPDALQPSPNIRYENGQVIADFTEFDKAGQWYFDELKLPHSYTPHMFYMFGWGHPPGRKFGQLPYPGEPPYDDADRSQLRPEFVKAYQACFKAFWDHVKQKGWQDKFTMYISDEPYDRQPRIQAQMRALCNAIHGVDPKIPIYSSTWHHVPAWDGYLNVWGVGHYGPVSAEKIAQLRKDGATVWFTTDGQMCTDTPYCAVERLLPHYCFKYGAEAYEFWGATWLTYDPYKFGWHAFIHQSGEPGKWIWVRYPNGDGFLIYPGKPIGYDGLVSSVRLEQARDGVEDYEYLYLLRSLVSRAKKAGMDTAHAENALRAADELVAIPNAGGRYSSKILPDPEAVYRVRRAVAEQIELLGR